MKTKQPEDEPTSTRLRDRLLLTIQFIQDVQEFPSGSQLRGIIEAAAAKGNLRTLRLMAREIDQMTIALQPDQRDGLDAILRQRLGVDKDGERAEEKRRVAKVLQRGTVASEKERRRLEDYAEGLEADGGDATEIAAVRRLLRYG